VLGIETQIGLSLVRELGEAGIPVIGIATGDKAIGLQSRYLAHGEILKKPRTVWAWPSCAPSASATAPAIC
jgi:hypothetical protein